jgi:hypothetical protein
VNEQEIAWLLHQAAEDGGVRERLLTDPKKTANTLGIEMSDESVGVIRKYVDEMKQRMEKGASPFIYPLPKITGKPGGTPKQTGGPKPK